MAFGTSIEGQGFSRLESVLPAFHRRVWFCVSIKRLGTLGVCLVRSVSWCIASPPKCRASTRIRSFQARAVSTKAKSLGNRMSRNPYFVGLNLPKPAISSSRQQHGYRNGLVIRFPEYLSQCINKPMSGVGGYESCWTNAKSMSWPIMCLRSSTRSLLGL